MSMVTRVLLVEDVPTDAELNEREIRGVLPDSEFLRVETEEGFLAALASFQPDILVSDYKLPCLDGLRVLELALERAPGLPFIVVTGSINEDTAVECMKAGAWDYVIKEHIKRLGPTVLSVMGQKRLRLERKAAEQELRDSEALFRGVFEEHPAVKLLIAPDDGRIVDANRAAAEFYGWPRERLRQMRVQDLNMLPPGEVMRAIGSVLARTQTRFEMQHRRADGSIRDVEIFSGKIMMRGGALLHSIVHDITERKRAEGELLRLQKAIEQAGESVCITDTTGMILFVNPAFEVVTGFSPQEVLGRNPRILKSGKHDDAFYQEMWAAISSGRTWKGRMVNKRKNGTLYTEDATISPVRGADGAIAYFVAVQRDVTEQVRLEDELRHSQKMESVGRLAGGVAHDFNNLLTAINGYAALLMDGLAKDDLRRKDMAEILAAGERAAALTRQLLAFSRKQILNPSVMDVNAVAGAVVKMLGRLIGEDIELRTGFAPQPCLIKADPGQVEQVLLNLAVNARDAMPGGGTLFIETRILSAADGSASGLRGTPSGGWVCLSVRDTGCGMADEVKAQLFEPFFTTKEKGKGTGLGLSTVYGIIKQSGGEIEVESAPGSGTTFRIFFPRMGEPARAPSKGADKTGDAAPRGSETILLVEDEAGVRRLAARALTDNGYVVLSASDGQEALKVLERHGRAVDLLITDVVMPGMSGRELAREVAGKELARRTLFVSGYTDEAIVHHGVLDGGLAFLDKPFTPEALLRKVRLVLDGPADRAKP